MEANAGLAPSRSPSSADAKQNKAKPSLRRFPLYMREDFLVVGFNESFTVNTVCQSWGSAYRDHRLNYIAQMYKELLIGLNPRACLREVSGSAIRTVFGWIETSNHFKFAAQAVEFEKLVALGRAQPTD